MRFHLLDVFHHCDRHGSDLHELLLQPGEIACRVKVLLARLLRGLTDFFGQDRDPLGPGVALDAPLLVLPLPFSDDALHGMMCQAGWITHVQLTFVAFLDTGDATVLASAQTVYHLNG